jgi:hypothetical protein
MSPWLDRLRYHGADQRPGQLAAAGANVIAEDIPFDAERVFQKGAAAGTSFNVTGGGMFTLQWSEQRAIFPTPGAGGFKGRLSFTTAIRPGCHHDH